MDRTNIPAGSATEQRTLGLELTCARCGGIACTLELIAPTPGSAEPDHIGPNEWRLKVDGPLSITHWVLRDLDALQAALERGSVEALRALDPEYVNAWCPKCAAVYCRTHWSPIEVVHDEGFYDAIYGTCPKGHRAMLDD